jgi:MerR family mercuric resistance operon transcriptional regulator
MEPERLTIGGVAVAAEVGVETVRYYERRGLVPQPKRGMGAYRRYGSDHVHRVRFIKRAQALGFSLEEIVTLLALEDGTDRRSIRRIASARLEETRRRIADLQRIERALAHLLHECETHAKSPRCPIIAAIGSAHDDGVTSSRRHGGNQALLSASRKLRTTA